MSSDLDFPILDIVSAEELHRELVMLALRRNKIEDPAKFVKDNSVDSKVSFRAIRVGDQTQMIAAVVINKAVPKDATSSPGSDKSEGS